MLPDLEHAERIGEFWSYTQTADCTFAELLIDSEEDRTLWTVLVGMLREGTARRWPGPMSQSAGSHIVASRHAAWDCPGPYPFCCYYSPFLSTLVTVQS